MKKMRVMLLCALVVVPVHAESGKEKGMVPGVFKKIKKLVPTKTLREISKDDLKRLLLRSLGIAAAGTAGAVALAGVVAGTAAVVGLPIYIVKRLNKIITELDDNVVRLKEIVRLGDDVATMQFKVYVTEIRAIVDMLSVMLLHANWLVDKIPLINRLPMPGKKNVVSLIQKFHNAVHDAATMKADELFELKEELGVIRQSQRFAWAVFTTAIQPITALWSKLRTELERIAKISEKAKEEQREKEQKTETAQMQQRDEEQEELNKNIDEYFKNNKNAIEGSINKLVGSLKEHVDTLSEEVKKSIGIFLGLQGGYFPSIFFNINFDKVVNKICDDNQYDCQNVNEELWKSHDNFEDSLANAIVKRLKLNDLKKEIDDNSKSFKELLLKDVKFLFQHDEEFQKKEATNDSIKEALDIAIEALRMAYKDGLIMKFQKKREEVQSAEFRNFARNKYKEILKEAFSKLNMSEFSKIKKQREQEAEKRRQEAKKREQEAKKREQGAKKREQEAKEREQEAKKLWNVEAEMSESRAYKIFEADKNTSAKDLKKKRRELLLVYHPDKNKFGLSKEEANNRAKVVNKAWNKLKETIHDLD